MSTVAYASFCCAKDIERARLTYAKHADSHAYPFDEHFFILQRCKPPAGDWCELPSPTTRIMEITKEMYPGILGQFGIKYPDPEVDHWTHGWNSSHFGFHHCVNHLRVLQFAKSDYIVFADADCHMMNQPEGKSWVNEGLQILESDPSVFVVSPSDGRPEPGKDRIMSQQVFLVNAKRMREMEFIPWDGTMPFGPMAEYYFMLEGRIDRFMRKHDLFRYVLPIEFRYYHNAWH